MADVPSPCNDQCARDARFNWCSGCLRSIDEVRAWRNLSNEQRQMVLHHCRQRAAWIAAQRVSGY